MIGSWPGGGAAWAAWAAWAVPASVPVQPDREQARSWAVQELARPEYQAARPGLVERVLTWVWDQLGRLDFGGAAPSGLGLLAFSLIIGVVVWYVVRRAGGLHPTARRAKLEVFSDRIATAADHRRAADRHAAAGEWDQAVVERFRAIARELEERALLSPQPGRTALELAVDGGAARPELAADLRAAAHSFDDVSYGHLSVDQEADRRLRELDARLLATKSMAVR